MPTTDCVMEWSREGDALDFGRMPRLADGVLGCAFDMPEGWYFSVIIAETPGSGSVSRFLSGLPHDRRIVFSNVISSHLRRMLLRRGFEDAWEEGVHVLQRAPVAQCAVAP